MSAPVIRPAVIETSWRCGRLFPSLSVSDISDRLGFEPGGAPRGPAGLGKVSFEWQFTVDGVPCAVWDYRGERWSFFGPRAVIARVFHGMVVPE